MFELDVTNPEHLAVAIRYRQGRDRAPLIVAMGAMVMLIVLAVMLPIIELNQWVR